MTLPPLLKNFPVMPLIWIKTTIIFLVWTCPKSSQDHPGNLISHIPNVGGFIDPRVYGGFSWYLDCGFTFMSVTGIPSTEKGGNFSHIFFSVIFDNFASFKSLFSPILHRPTHKIHLCPNISILGVQIDLAIYSAHNL